VYIPRRDSGLLTDRSRPAAPQLAESGGLVHLTLANLITLIVISRERGRSPLGAQTRAIRAGTLRKPVFNEHNDALFPDLGSCSTARQRARRSPA